MQSLCGTRSNYKNRWRAKEDSLAHVGLRPRLCENSDLSIVRENPTAQNGPQSTIGTSGDILQLPKTRAVGVFTQPGPIADSRVRRKTPSRRPSRKRILLRRRSLWCTALPL